MTKTEREARARVKDEQAKLAAYDAETDKKRAANAAATKKIERRRWPAVYLRSDGETVDLTDMTRVKPGYIGRELTDKELIAAIIAGGVKLETDGSVQRAAKTVAKNLRAMNQADTRTLRRLDAQLAKLRAARDTLIHDSWARGTAMSVEGIAASAVEMHSLHKLTMRDFGYGARGGPEDWRRRGIESELTDATIHLRFTTGDMDPETTECPCLVCRKARTEAQARAEREKEWTDAPRVKVWCRHCEATHITNLRIMNVRMPDGELREGAPVFRCAKASKDTGTPLVLDTKRWDRLVELRHEARERALRRDGVTYTCPNESCGEEVVAIPQPADDNDGLFLECPVCEWGTYLADVKLTGRNARRYAA